MCLKWAFCMKHCLTLTPYVEVRILLPLPKKKEHRTMLFFLFIPFSDAFSTPFPTGLARSPLDGRAMRVTVGAGYAHQIE